MNPTQGTPQLGVDQSRQQTRLGLPLLQRMTHEVDKDNFAQAVHDGLAAFGAAEGFLEDHFCERPHLVDPEDGDFREGLGQGASNACAKGDGGANEVEALRLGGDQVVRQPPGIEEQAGGLELQGFATGLVADLTAPSPNKMQVTFVRSFVKARDGAEVAREEGLGPDPEMFEQGLDGVISHAGLLACFLGSPVTFGPDQGDTFGLCTSHTTQGAHMANILPLDPSQASPEVAAILQAVKAKLGRVPNLFLTLAKSPAALKAYLGASEAIGNGRLDPKSREMVALAVAEANGCDYCLSAHSAIGKMVGLDEEAIIQARGGVPAGQRQAALVAFSRAVIRERGRVSLLDLQAAREAGLDDEDLVEAVANVAVNVFTNYLNHVADTAVDFPKVAQLTTV